MGDCLSIDEILFYEDFRMFVFNKVGYGKYGIFVVFVSGIKVFDVIKVLM